MEHTGLDFEGVHQVFRPKMLRYLTRLVGQQEAEDLTQEVFLRVAAGLKGFRGESKLDTWIYRIATNAALDRLRSPSYQQTVRKELSSELSAERQEDESPQMEEKMPSVEQSLIRKQMNQCIRDFVENLPGNHRAVVILSELEGLKNQDIGEILGISLDTVKMRLHRARARLKKELESHCEFYRDEQNELACDLKSAFEKS